jgi:Arm DNA-binding domain
LKSCAADLGSSLLPSPFPQAYFSPGPESQFFIQGNGSRIGIRHVQVGDFVIGEDMVCRKGGQLPIYFRLTVNGERFEFSTKKFIEKSKWPSEQSKMKGNSEEARSLNNYLDLIKSKVFDIQMDLLHKNEELNQDWPELTNVSEWLFQFIKAIMIKLNIWLETVTLMEH